MSPLSRQSVCLSDLVLNSDQHFRTDLLGQIHKVSDKGATSIPRHDEKYNGSQAAQCALYKEGFKISQISPKNHSLREMPTYFMAKNWLFGHKIVYVFIEQDLGYLRPKWFLDHLTVKKIMIGLGMGFHFQSQRSKDFLGLSPKLMAPPSTVIGSIFSSWLAHMKSCQCNLLAS